MSDNPIQILLCDDEDRILLELKAKVEQTLADMEYRVGVETCNSGKALAGRLEQLPADILLLDIDMPYVDGMEIAKRISDKKLPILLIFVTNKESLVYDSFQYHPFAFIRKSMFEKEIADVLGRAMKQVTQQKTLFLTQGTEKVRVELEDVLYIEADGNYMKLVGKSGIVRHRGTMADMEERLGQSGFVRIHKGFLVNTDAIYRIQADSVVLTNQEKLPIGRSNREEIRRRLMRSFRL